MFELKVSEIRRILSVFLVSSNVCLDFIRNAENTEDTFFINLCLKQHSVKVKKIACPDITLVKVKVP